MSNNVKIYKKRTDDKNRLDYVCELNYTYMEFVPSFYSDWVEGEHVAGDTFYTNPILGENDEVRAMTHEEEFRYGLAGLYDGEYIENDKIKVRETPTNFYRPKWNPTTTYWEEGIDADGIRAMIKEKENKMIEIKNIIRDREEMEFDTDDEEAELAKVKDERKKLKDDLFKLFSVTK